MKNEVLTKEIKLTDASHEVLCTSCLGIMMDAANLLADAYENELITLEEFDELLAKKQSEKSGCSRCILNPEE